MFWPTLLDYQEAIQNPRTCFQDQELKNGTPVLNQLGLPKPVSGGFACVYQMNCVGRQYAVRCFLTKKLDQDKRYRIISDFLKMNKLSYMVGFEYLSNGIKVNGQWYPILKMEWIDGDPLNFYVEKHLNNPEKLEALAANFQAVVRNLALHSIVHGDLQHGNILVAEDQVKLIDYDGLYVPGLETMPSNEYGHRNYQHPARKDGDSGLGLDNFSAWIIYGSIMALAQDSTLWTLADGDECLIFRKEDFLDPDQALVFKQLSQSGTASLRFMGRKIRDLLNFTEALALPALNPAGLALTRAEPPASGLPVWLQSYVPAEVSTEVAASAQTSKRLQNDFPNAGINTFTSVLTERFLAGAWLLGLTAYMLLVFRWLDLQASFFILALWTSCGGWFMRRQYNSQPGVRNKTAVISQFKELGVDISKIKETLERYAKEKKDMARKLEGRIKKIQEIGRDTDRTEKNELERYHKNYTKQIEKINEKLKENLISEKKEISNSQRVYQNSYLLDEMRKNRLCDTSIPGIGPQLVRALHKAGIMTAADLRTVHIIQNRTNRRLNSGNEVALIDVRGKGNTRIEGIGPIKARALLEWKNKLEAKIGQTVSSQITQQNLIKEKYRQERDLLEKVINHLKRDYSVKISEIKNIYTDERINLRNDMESYKADYQQMIEVIEGTIEKENIKRMDMEEDRYSLELCLLDYEKITAINYLKQIFYWQH